MRCYADTSWWLAYKWRRDAHHASAVPFFNSNPDAQVIWTPWQRVKVFNLFRQTERSGFLKQGEAHQVIRLLDHEVRLGYWPHVQFSWTDATRTAERLSSRYSLTMPIRGMDLFHVAIAIEIGCERFLSFDDDQNEFAAAAGLRVEYPKRP
jgi:predicted nucleic acid-binding protein